MHSTQVGLVLNLLTGSISPQYHVLFYDNLSTVMSSTAADPEVWIRLVIQRNSRIQVMLDQEDDTEVDDEWLTADGQLTCFSKAREQIVGDFKGTESSSVQGPQSYEEDLVVKERVPSKTEKQSVIQPGTNGNHEPIGQAQNGGFSANRQEIPVSMDNVCQEGTEDQYITYTSGEDLGRNVDVRCSERIRNSPQRYDPGFGAAREFLMRLECLTWTFLSKSSPLGNSMYWYSLPSGHKLSIETGISWILALYPSFYA